MSTAARRSLIGLVLMAGLVACGTTVPVQQQGAALGGVESDLGGPAAPAASAPPAPSSGDAPGSVPSQRGSSGVSTSAGDPQAPPSAAAPRATADGSGPGAPGAAVGPGVTAKTIDIGYQYVRVGSGGTSAITGKDVSIGDPEADARAVTSWINAHGGLGGRRMVLRPFGVDYAGYLSNAQAAYAVVCTHFTQDVKVLAVAVYVPDRSLLSCLSRKGVLSVSDGYSLDRTAFDREFPTTYWSPGSMSQDRGAELGVEGLWDARFLTGTAKVGILRYEETSYERAEKSLRRALASHGLGAVTQTVSYSSASSAESDAAAAVLRFRSQGITHVMVLDNSGGITYAFMQAAESQAYRPSYALTTNNSPQALQQLAPAAQLKKAQAVSWWSGDVGDRTDQASPPAVPSARAACLKIMKDAGLDVSGTAAGTALITCDQLLVLKAVLDRGASPSAAGRTATLNGLGTTYTSPLTYGTRFGAQRHDAAYLTRRIRFDGDCSCWLYAGPGPTA
jgi:hypothetical protein